MKIKSLAFSDIEELSPEQDKANIELSPEEGEATEELSPETEDIVEETELEDVELFYIEPDTGLKSLTNEPSTVTANDGTEMITGLIGVGGLDDMEEIDRLLEQGLLDRIVDFVNVDPRIDIDKNSLITDKISEGYVSFIVSPNVKSASSSRIILTSSEADQSKIDKVCKDFFSKFSISKDLSDFNINSANKELYELLEKVAVNLTPLEKKRVRKHIRKRLAEHNIKLTYLEINA